MANTVEKIFRLLMEFGDSEARTDKMNKLLQLLNARLRDVLKTIQEIGASDGLKKASEVLGVYKLTIDSATKSKKKLVEVDKEENAQSEAAKKYIDQLKSKYGNLTFTKKEIAALTKNYAILQRAEKGSIEETTAKINILNTAWRKMGAEQLKSTPGKQVTAELKQMRDSLRTTTVSAGDFSRNIGRYAGGIQSAFAKIGAAWMALRGVFNFFRGSIKTIMDFEQANANLATVLGKSAGDIKDLTKSALELGRTTEYTASQVTQLQTELAKLGFGERSIEMMQESILQFATAVGASLPDAAALAGATLRAFDLGAKDTEEMLSVLAVATNKSALSFSYLQTSMSIVSPVARMFGFDVKDTAALLGTLANSGFDASMAATATRNILLHLADANGKLAKALGKPVRTLPELVTGLKSLREHGVDLATTLELTDKRSVAAFNTFLNGADSLMTLRGQLEDTGEELKRIQEERLNTVEGSVKLLTSAWEGLILSFSSSKGAFKTVVDGLTSIVGAISDLINPQAKVDRRIKTMVDQIVEEYNVGGEQAANSYMNAGVTVKERHVKGTKQNWIESKLGIGYDAAKESYDSYIEFSLATTMAAEQIAKIKAESEAAQQKAFEDEKARVVAEKAAKIKAAEEFAKIAKTAQDKATKEEESYTSNRKAQEDKLLKYENDHIDAGIAAMKDGVEKKIRLNEQATKKAQESALKEYQTEVDRLNKELKANKDTPAKIAQIEAEKTALAKKYDQKTTDIKQAETNTRVKIFKDASKEELEEYGKLPDKAAEVERQITENKRREVEKRLELSKRELVGADDKFIQNETIADATYGTDPKDKERHAARLKNELELRQAKAQTYMADLAAMQEAEQTETAAYAQTIANIGRLKQESENLGNGLSADGTGGGFKGWLMRSFEITPEQIEQLKQQAFDLSSQLGDAMIQAQQQASQRRLKNEKKAIDAQYKTESKLLDSKRDKGLISEKKYQEELEKLEAEKAAKEEAAERAAFEREKRLNIMQVIMNTAISIAKTFAQMGWLPGLPFAALAAASGAIQIATIASQKYAQGGLIPLGDGAGVVKGRSHAQGGHRIYLDGQPIGEIEGDELLAIVNKRDTARIGALSAANSVHGRKFATGGLITSGGYMVSSVSPPVSIGQIEASQRAELIKRQEAQQMATITAIREDTKQQIAAINSRIDRIKVVVLAQDMTDTQNDIKKIKVKSSW